MYINTRHCSENLTITFSFTTKDNKLGFRFFLHNTMSKNTKKMIVTINALNKISDKFIAEKYPSFEKFFFLWIEEGENDFAYNFD